MAAEPEVEARKRALRRHARAARAAVSERERHDRSRRITQHLQGLDAVGAARAVAGYAATPQEVDLDPLLERLLAGGTRVLLPWVDGHDVHLAQVADLATDLAAGHRGVREPRAALRLPVDPSRVDVVVVPGLAFDSAGRRLGAGGGHLDRLLDAAGPAPLRIGVAFAAQLVPRVPTEAHDQRVHLVITERGVSDARAG